MSSNSVAELTAAINNERESLPTRRQAARDLGDSVEQAAIETAVALCNNYSLPRSLQEEVGRSLARLAARRGKVKETFDLHTFDMSEAAYLAYANLVETLDEATEG